MKFFLILTAFALTVFTGVSAEASAAEENKAGQVIYRAGTQASVKGSPDIFTGNVRVDPLYPAGNGMRSIGGSVTFEPGRSFQLACSPCGAGIDHNFRRGPDPGMGQTRPGSPSG